jgi:CubicO group peptidase (beta-lactamase class C family)
VGQLVLHNGEWQGRQLVDPAWVKRMVTYDQAFFSGMPQDSLRFRPGLGWWTNSGGAWPALPRDAFCGIGAGNQILLIVPSLDLIAVRNGDLLIDSPKEADFWEGLRRYFFIPLSETLKDSPQAAGSSNRLRTSESGIPDHHPNS